MQSHHEMHICVYIKKLLRFPLRKGNKSHYLLLITKIHATTIHAQHHIQALFGANLSLEPPFPTPSPPSKAKSSFVCILLFFTHFQTFKKKTNNNQKKNK